MRRQPWLPGAAAVVLPAEAVPRGPLTHPCPTGTTNQWVGRRRAANGHAIGGRLQSAKRRCRRVIQWTFDTGCRPAALLLTITPRRSPCVATEPVPGYSFLLAARCSARLLPVRHRTFHSRCRPRWATSSTF